MLVQKKNNPTSYNTNKIIVRIVGGLGNQLFIYAAARRLALVNNVELVLDDISGFENDFKYQRFYQLDHFHIPSRKATPTERFEPLSKIRRYLKRYYNQYLPFERRKYLMHEGIDFDPRLIEFKPSGIVYLEGYWQSEDYFKDIETIIRQDLEIKPPIDTLNRSLSIQISNSVAVAVHVRFFDQSITISNNNATDDYYKHAIEIIENTVKNAHYFIFSDQADVARQRIPLPDERITLVSHNKGDSNAYADLWLMTQCQHFIIANSTFSWWAAWLAKNQEKKIICPRKIEGSITAWGFKGLIPSSWHCL